MDSMDVNTRIVNGNELNGLGKFQDAISCYDRAFEIRPMYAVVGSNKGLALRGLGRYQESIEKTAVSPTLQDCNKGSDFVPIEFLGFSSFEDLHLNGFGAIPIEKGIYAVIVPDFFDVQFLDHTTAITNYRGRNLLYLAHVLTTKYNSSDRKILYIGKVGGVNGLCQRIRQYVRYGYGEARNHRGGRAIWQIDNNKQLLIGYWICDEPEAKERELLAEYHNRYGTFPVANWRG